MRRKSPLSIATPVVFCHNALMNVRETPNESEPSNGGTNFFDRRKFLLGLAASAAAAGTLGAACSSDKKSSDGSGSGTTNPTGPTVTTPTAKNTPKLDGDPFSLGVASGDPDASSVVLWTRLAVDPVAGDGNGGMPDESADVIWEAARDKAFKSVFAAGVFTTETKDGHSAHVILEDLDPGQKVYYRFIYDEWTSPVGTTATLPDGSPENFKIAVANCQMYESCFAAV